jgi:hypothetical protein
MIWWLHSSYVLEGSTRLTDAYMRPGHACVAAVKAPSVCAGGSRQTQWHVRGISLFRILIYTRASSDLR